jgi:hypothetical protein
VATGGEAVEEVGPGHRPVALEEGERVGEDRGDEVAVAALEHQAVVEGGVAGRGQAVQPGEVVGGDEMDGAADRPGAHEATVGEDRAAIGARHAGADREGRGADVLRLHADDGANGLGRGRGGGLGHEALGGEAAADELNRHGPYPCPDT